MEFKPYFKCFLVSMDSTRKLEGIEQINMIPQCMDIGLLVISHQRSQKTKNKDVIRQVGAHGCPIEGRLSSSQLRNVPRARIPGDPGIGP